MDAALSRLVRSGEVDAGLLYVLVRNTQTARADGDEERLRLYTHLHTRCSSHVHSHPAPTLQPPCVITICNYHV